MSDTKNPLKFSLYAISINIVLSIPLYVGFGVIGIAYATSISAWIHVLIFYKKLKELSLVSFGKDTLADIIKVLFSSAIMFLVISLLINNINLIYPAISLVILVMIGSISYLVCLFFIGFYRFWDLNRKIKDVRFFQETYIKSKHNVNLLYSPK